MRDSAVIVMSLTCPAFKSFELPYVTLKLFNYKLTVYNVYRPSSATTKTRKYVPFSVFLGELDFLLTLAATNFHEFLIIDLMTPTSRKFYLLLTSLILREQDQIILLEVSYTTCFFSDWLWSSYPWYCYHCNLFMSAHCRRPLLRFPFRSFSYLFCYVNRTCFSSTFISVLLSLHDIYQRLWIHSWYSSFLTHLSTSNKIIWSCSRMQYHSI